ncbi:Ig-like domain-containing protein [Stieleria neptunia]|nr:Ig-like domain-containing protein [Stieleria neptunia]
MTKFRRWITNSGRRSFQNQGTNDRAASRRRRMLAESLEDRRVLAATVPLIESFEVADLAALTDWTFATTGGGTVGLDTASAAQTGTTSLRFDTTASFSNVRSDAVLELDLSGVSTATDLTFDFWMKRLNSSTHQGFFMQIDASGDGSTWTTLSPSLQPVGNVWIHYVYDLDQRLADAGVALDSDVFLRLRHASYFTTHESIVDDVRVGQFGDLIGPAVETISPNSMTTGPVSSVDVTFSEPVDATTFNAADVAFTSADGSPLALVGDPVDSGNQTTFTLNFDAAQTLNGTYHVHIDSDVTDIAGNRMNQDGDEVSGETIGDDDFMGTFEIGPTIAQSIPYFQDFEVADLQSLDGWSFHAVGDGSSTLDTALVKAGSTALRTTGGGYSGENLIELHLNLQNKATATDLVLDYWAARGGRGVHSPGSQIVASNDRITWTDIFTPELPVLGRYQNYFIDLDAELDAAKISRNSDVYLRFERSSFSNESISFDDLRIAQRDGDGPYVTAISPATATTGPLSQIDVTFNEAIDAASFTVDDLQILDIGGNQVLLSGDPVDSGDQMTFTLNLATPQSVKSNYRLTIGPDVLDVAGNGMNQDRDQINTEPTEDRYQTDVVVGPATPQSIPYFEDFESDDLASLSGWTFSADGTGLIWLTEADEPYSPSRHLAFSQTDSSVQDAMLVVDLSGQTGATDLALDFRAKRLFQSYFRNAMTVQASGDGSTWTQLGPTISSDFGTYVNYFFDLDQELAAASIALDGDVYFRFSHEGSSSSYQMRMDDVRIANRDADGPRVATMTPDGSATAPLSQLQIQFNEVIVADTFTASDVTVLGPLGEIPVSADPVDTGDAMTFNITLDEAVSQTGQYQVLIGPDVLDLSGNQMNQDADNANGDAEDRFQGSFQFEAVPSDVYPYYQGFSGIDELNGNWFFRSEPDGRIQLVDDGGRQVLRMDNPGGASVNQAILSIDLAGKTGVRLAFNENRRNDSTTAGDTLRLSNDQGQTWHSFNMLFSASNWDSYDIDLDAVIAGIGIAYTDNFWIMIQQYGTNAWPSNGRQYDDFRVTADTTAPSVVSHSPTGLVRPPGPLDHFDLTFSEPINPSTFSLDDVKLTREFVDISDRLVGISGSGQEFTVSFSPSGLGHYELTVGPEILDLGGNPLDQNGAGGAGQFPQDQYVAAVDFNDPYRLGYRETFAGGLPIDPWNFLSYGAGAISVVDERLRLEASYQNPIDGHNRAILHLDLAGESRAKLNFDAFDFDGSTTSSPAIGTQGDGFSWRDVVAVSDDGGSTWTILDLLNSSGYKSYDLAAFAAANNLSLVDNFLVMFQQHSNRTARDAWEFDNIVVERETLSLSTVNATVVEGTTDEVFVRVEREADADLTSELLVWLSSNDTSEATVPSTVTIPADAMFVDVPVTIEDDTEIDGPQRVGITVGADGVAPQTIDFTVLDNEPATLLVGIDRAVINEIDGPRAATGTVTRNRGLDSELVVSLSSSDPSAFTVGETVTIPIGETSATFDIASHNDYLVDGTQSADVNVAATGFVSGSASLQVEDDDTAEDRTIGGFFSGELPKDDYTVTFDVQVPTGDVWTIDPGANLFFDPGTSLNIAGTVLAEGQTDNEILFTSSATTPAPGDWIGIDFNASGQSRSIFDHVEIAFATTALDVSNQDLPIITLRDSHVHDSAVWGVLLDAGRGHSFTRQNVMIEGNRIHDNSGFGVYVRSSAGACNQTFGCQTTANPTITGNEIFGHQQAGIWVSSSYSLGGLYASSGGASPTVTKNHVHNNAIGIRAGVHDPESFGTAWTSGFYANNLVVDNTSTGILLEQSVDGNQNSQLLNNTIVGNGGAGISHDTNRFGGVIRNNLVASNRLGIEADAEYSPSVGRVGFNDVYGNDEGNWMNYPSAFGTATTTNANGTPSDAEFNLSVDPMFADGSLYVPVDASPVNDAGTDADAPHDDYRGAFRHVPYDIGAYEHDPVNNVVTTLLDEDDGGLGLGAGNSLREVINATNARPGLDVITFDPDLNGGVISLGATTLPTLSNATTIEGPGAEMLTITGNDQVRIFTVGTSVDVNISGLTLRDAAASAINNSGNLTVTDSIMTSGVAVNGGGIYNTVSGNLMVLRSTISENTVSSNGGAIYNSGAASIVDSTINGNTAGRTAGGIYNISLRALAIIQTTISGNSALYIGGGIENRGPDLVIRQSTITGNIADSDNDGSGGSGGISNGGTTIVHNSIIAGNLRGTSTPSDAGPLDPSSTHNLIGDAASAGGLVNGENGNIVGADARLAPLADHGGPTWTHALHNASPAIDAGDNAHAVDADSQRLGFDQRGSQHQRFIDGNRSGTATVDIGAFETLPPPIVDGIVINGGHDQRSRLDRLAIRFDQPVRIDDDGDSPFELINLDTNQRVDVSANVDPLDSPSTLLLTFLPGPSVGPGGMLLDGNYQLTMKASLITVGAMVLDGNGDGTAADHVFGNDATDNFFRFFGDSDGDRDVDGQDYGRFGLTFLKQTGMTDFDPTLDADADGDVDGHDYGRFGLNFLKRI